MHSLAPAGMRPLNSSAAPHAPRAPGPIPRLQLQRTCLRIITAVRPGCVEHVTVAAIHACDAGGGM